MPYKTVFERYELKYMLTADQKARIMKGIAPHMIPDKYGHATIRNIYFDTDSYRLIRRSIEKPVYKEKLRLRSYTQADINTPIFVELKKKYRSVVYKRRLSMGEHDAMKWLCGHGPCPRDTQISREIEYFLGFYKGLHPSVFLSYRREAFFSSEDSDFRLTFDNDILCRQNDLSLCSGVGGTSLLSPGTTLMELKCAGGIPLWMTELLSAERIYKTSFSKYGKAYETLIFPGIYGCQSQKEIAFYA